MPFQDIINGINRGTYSGAMDGIGSDESIDIRGGPRRKRLLTLCESCVVFEKREPLSPELLVTFPVLPEEWLLFWCRCRWWWFSHLSLPLSLSTSLLLLLLLQSFNQNSTAESQLSSLEISFFNYYYYIDDGLAAAAVTDWVRMTKEGRNWLRGRTGPDIIFQPNRPTSQCFFFFFFFWKTIIIDLQIVWAQWLWLLSDRPTK